MKHFFFISLLLFGIVVNAQINFEKGYFITNSNEKVECYIKNLDWWSNPSEFDYKINLNEKESTTAKINDVKEFTIEGESKYKRFEVNIEKSETMQSNLSQSKYPVWEKQTLFLKILIDGEASLYSYTESSILKFFYSTKTKPIEQLVFITYKTEDEIVKTNSMFRQQLYNNVRNEDTKDFDYNSIEYNSNALIALFSKYNQSNGNTANSYVAKSKKEVLKLKITAGSGVGKLAIFDPTDYLHMTHTLTKAVINAGIEVEYILPFNKNKWSIFINPNYQKFKAEKNYIVDDGLNPVTNHVVTVDYGSISFPLGIRYYMFLNKDSKIFLNGMYSANFSSNSSINFDNGSRIMKIKPDGNIVLGAGYTFKDRYSIEFRRVFPRELLGQYAQWSAQYTAFEVQFSYKIL